MEDKSLSEPETLEELVEEYLSLRQGDGEVTVELFAKKHPCYEAEILDLFPTLLALEKYKPSSSNTLPERMDARRAGSQIGDYQLIREVGRGGMGVVYEAVQISLGRKVAIKVLGTHHAANQDNLVRFEREAIAAASLIHNNIVPVFGAGNSDGTDFLVMQFIEGQALDRVIAEMRQLKRPALATTGDHEHFSLSYELTRGRNVQAPKFFEHVAQIGIQVASGLQYAHSKGVLHRDVKPGNILLDASARAWLTDFGLAKTEQDDGLTKSGNVLGTLRYMAPEALKCKADKRSDVYSLGLTLFELITLRPAFRDSEKGSMVEQLMSPTVQLDAGPVDMIPADLVAIVNKAIDPLPEYRYQTAQELVEDLQRYLDDIPIHARKSSTVLRLSKWRRKNRVLANSLLCGALLLTLFSLCSVAAAIYFRTLSDRLEGSVAELGEANAKADAQRERAERVAYSSLIALAQGRIGAEDKRGALLALESSQSKSIPRGWEWHFLNYACLGQATQLEKRGLLGACVAFSCDGKLVASAVDQGPGMAGKNEQQVAVVIHDVKSGLVVKELFSRQGEIRAITFRQDGEVIATVVGSNVVFYDVASGEIVHIEAESGDPDCKSPYRIEYSPDGSNFFLVWKNHTGGRGITNVHDSSSMEAIATLSGRCAAFSSDGAKVYYSNGSWIKSHRLDVTLDSPKSQSNKIDVPGLATGEAIWALATSADGRNLAYGAGKRAVIWDLKKNRVRRHLWVGHSPEFLAFSPDGNRLAVKDITVGKLQLWDAKTGNRLASLGGLNSNRGAAFSTDLGLRASADREGVLALYPSVDGAGKHVTRRWIAHASSLQFGVDDNSIHSVHRGVIESWQLPRLDNYTRQRRQYGRDIWPRSDWGMSPDAKCVAGPQENDSATACVWNLADGTKLLETDSLKSRIREVAFSRDSSVFAVLAGSRDVSEIQVWDLGSQTLIDKLTLASELVTAIALSSDGGTIAIAPHSDSVRIRSLASGKERKINMAIKNGRLMFSPDCLALAATDAFADSVQVFDLGKQKCVAKHNSVRAAFGLDWSPDGNRLAVAGYDNVYIFDASSGLELLVLQRFGPATGTRGYTPCIKFSHDGRLLAANSAHHVLTVWDAGPSFTTAKRAGNPKP